MNKCYTVHAFFVAEFFDTVKTKINQMAIINYFERIKRIDQFIRMQATGTPKELADKLGLSKSTVFEYIYLMKEMNAPIEYDNFAKSYIYTKKGKFILEFELSELSDNELKNIDAGEILKKYSFFLHSPIISDC